MLSTESMPSFGELVAQLMAPSDDDRYLALNRALQAANKNKPIVSRRELRTLLRLACTDSSRRIRNEATESLGEWGTKQDIRALVDRASDLDWVVRASAYSSLALLAKASAAAVLRKGMQDGHPVVRRYAAYALWRALGTAALPFLRAALAAETADSARVGMISALAESGDELAIDQIRLFAESPDGALSNVARETLATIEGRTGVLRPEG